MMLRAPVGQSAEVSFKNPDSDTPWVANLTAADDDQRSLRTDRGQTQDIDELESPLQF